MALDARNLIHGILSSITRGYLVLKDPDGTSKAFGVPGSSPTGTIVVHDKRFYKRVLRDGSLGLGESFMNGWWEAENGDVASCIGVLLSNKLEASIKPNMRLVFAALMHRLFANASRGRSKSNIAKHYDAGNDLYERFLDENMGYTCGYQLSPTDTIEQMQDQKHERVCRKLDLKPGERIIDLGCGFGGMLRYAAKTRGISGAGVTLSERQTAWANAKIQSEDLQDRIRVDLKDYRDTEGTYDKVVSIGLAEHTWQRGYDVFFGKISSLIAEGGVGLVHTIGLTEDPDLPVDRWTDKYIFPDGRLPRLEELAVAARRAGLTIGHVENLKPHYAETLRHWKEKFNRNRDEIGTLDKKYDEKFLRMWDYYLQACEAGFRHGTLQLYQILFCKGTTWTLPMRFEFDQKAA